MFPCVTQGLIDDEGVVDCDTVEADENDDPT